MFSTALAELNKQAAIAAGENSKKIMGELLDNRVDGPLVPKKKKRQLKLKQAFERNFQKYPVKKCVWVPEFQKHVYEPPRYTKAMDALERSYAKCCPDCYLRPCLMVGEQRRFIEEHKGVVEDPVLAICNGEVIAYTLFVRYFGKNYVKRMKIDRTPLGLPTCVVQALPVLLEKAKEELAGKVHHDEDANSVGTTVVEDAGPDEDDHDEDDDCLIASLWSQQQVTSSDEEEEFEF